MKQAIRASAYALTIYTWHSGKFYVLYANFCIADVSVWYERTSYTISQQNDNVTICVISTSPGIEEMFTINIITNNRTASKYFLLWVFV